MSRLNAKHAKMLRGRAQYHGGPHPGYEFNGIHHLQETPVYVKHDRVIRTMGSDGKIVTRTVTKIRYGIDGKTPLAPEWIKAKDKDGRIVMIPKTEIAPVLKPVTLNKSPKAAYRRLKRAWERNGVSPCLIV